MKKENITVLRKILYAVESGGQVYGKQNYGAFAGVGANTPNEKAITIGAGQWYAEEARTLLLNIQKKYPKEFKKLDTAGIAADLNKSWETYGVTKTSAKGKCIIAIITSAGGIKCQDALMETQIKTYAASIEKKYGSLSDDAMMECINIIHQGGSGALTRILAKTQKPYTAKTIYAALCTDPADKSNNNQVGDYEDRQKVVYGFITKYCNKEGVNTMGYSRQAVADLVNSWVGKNEADGSYKTIIDIYNSYKGAFPRGTKMDYSWPWCACTWSAAAIKLGYTPIMPIEISCYYLIEAAKKKGIWIENDAHVPKVGEGVEINDDTGEAAPSHGPVAASSLIQQRRLIIAALEYAVDKGRISRNPGKKTRRPKSKPKTNNILTDEEMETLGIKGTKYRYYPAYMLTLTTACRRGEILGLDWQHVDIGIPWTTVDRYFPWGDIKKLPKWDTKALKTLLEDHNITLGDGYLRLVYQIVDDNGTPFRDELKTDLSRRSLMITEEMVLLLIFWRLVQNTEKRKAMERGIEYNPDNLVFCTRKGTYIYPRNFTKMWSENLRSMGIDHKRFHDLRHTVATVMLEDGEAMNTVQEQLGHYDAGFTASRYGHVTAKMRNSAAVKLGERLEKVRNPEAEDEEDANSVKKEDTVIPFQEGRKLKSAACKIK